MSSMRRRRPSSEGAAPAQAASSPSWAADVTATLSNAQVIELVTGQSVDEEQANSLLDGAKEETVPAWAQDLQSVPESRPQGTLGPVYDRNTDRLSTVAIDLDARHKNDVAFFLGEWKANKARYEAVAAAAGVPAMLIAALHYRESSMDFDTYLHQGDKLGKAAVNHPADIPLFHDWEKAATHALGMKSGIADSLGIDADTTNAPDLATYAEAYNGLGYHYRDIASPYVYGGTDAYDKGLFVSDGRFDRTVTDRRPGVVALMDATDQGLELPDPAMVQANAWERILAGGAAIRLGAHGTEVKALQAVLANLGYDVTVDGDFGPATQRAVLEAQEKLGVTIDGVVGPGTAAALGPFPTAPTPEPAPAA